MSHGRWWGSLLPLNHLRTAASPCPRWFPLKFGNFCQDMEWQRMAVWASILQSTADIRHLYRFAKEIHQKKAKSMVFQYSKYLLDFNKISPIPSWKKPWDTNLIGRTSTRYHICFYWQIVSAVRVTWVQVFFLCDVRKMRQVWLDQRQNP